MLQKGFNISEMMTSVYPDDIQSFNHQSQLLFFNVNITSHYTLHVSAHMQAIISGLLHRMMACIWAETGSV
jgi:hypothetical protein